MRVPIFNEDKHFCDHCGKDIGRSLWGWCSIECMRSLSPRCDYERTELVVAEIKRLKVDISTYKNWLGELLTFSEQVLITPDNAGAKRTLASLVEAIKDARKWEGL
jgi:hypothetical protein